MSSELAIRSKTSTEITPMFAAAPDFAGAVERYGEWIYESCMFGCKTKGQAKMLAWSWLARGKDPIEMKRQYHFIKGELTLKYRVMASHFLKAGGKIHPIARTPELASVTLEYNGTKASFSFTYKECLQEDYVWTTDANFGKVPKFINGEVNKAALKDNWSTPRRRMQMLWSRVITDGISTIAADCTEGYYAAEEMGDYVDGEAFATDEAIVQPAPVTQVQQQVEDAVFVPKELHDDRRNSTPDVRGGSVSQDATPKTQSQGGEEQESTSQGNGVAKAAAPGSGSESQTIVMETVVINRNGPATQEQLTDLANLKNDLAIGGDAWKQMLAKYSVATARALTFGQADDFTATLMRILSDRNAKKEQESFLST